MIRSTLLRSATLAGAAVAALAGFGPTPASAQDASVQDQPVRVEELRLSPGEHLNEIRTLEGVVERLVNREGGEAPAFYLEDDFGHQLLVIPFDSAPARGARVRVTGVVTVDDVGDPVLTLFEADGLRAADATAAPAEPVASPVEAPVQVSPVRGNAWLLALGGAVALVALWLVVARLRAPDERPLVTGHQDVDFATSALWPESDREFEGRTLRFTRPDPTVRLMSARLEVIGGGDAGEEIRFVGRPGDEVTMMFGRAPGEGEGAVQLKQKTVSRTHAVVRHRHGEWLLENLSMTNPTVLNGETLGAKERLLTEGDRIEMGEVVFLFRE